MRSLPAWVVAVGVCLLCGLAVAAVMMGAAWQQHQQGEFRDAAGMRWSTLTALGAAWLVGAALLVGLLGWAGRTWNAYALGGRPTIALELGGFAVRLSNGKNLSVPWATVVRVAAYKRDRVTTDEIVLGFELSDQLGSVLELSEEWPGFAELLAPMEAVLRVSPAWYAEIVTPAFAATPRILYTRRDGSEVGPPAG